MPTRQRQNNKDGESSYVSDEVALVIHATLLATWTGCLLWASLSSQLPAIPRFLAWDKLQHFFAYAILMLFSGNFLRLLFRNRQKGWLIGFGFTVGFGLLMEIGQKVLAISRYADWKDLIANTLGAGLVLAIMLLKKGEKS